VLQGRSRESGLGRCLISGSRIPELDFLKGQTKKQKKRAAAKLPGEFSAILARFFRDTNKYIYVFIYIYISIWRNQPSGKNEIKNEINHFLRAIKWTTGSLWLDLNNLIDSQLDMVNYF